MRKLSQYSSDQKLCGNQSLESCITTLKEAINHQCLDKFFFFFARKEVKGYSWSVLIHLEALDHTTAHMDQLLS